MGFAATLHVSGDPNFPIAEYFVNSEEACTPWSSDGRRRGRLRRAARHPRPRRRHRNVLKRPPTRNSPALRCLRPTPRNSHARTTCRVGARAEREASNELRHQPQIHPQRAPRGVAGLNRPGRAMAPGR
jgi:hypothetical protein